MLKSKTFLKGLGGGVLGGGTINPKNLFADALDSPGKLKKKNC